MQHTVCVCVCVCVWLRNLSTYLLITSRTHTCLTQHTLFYTTCQASLCTWVARLGSNTRSCTVCVCVCVYCQAAHEIRDGPAWKPSGSHPTHSHHAPGVLTSATDMLVNMTDHERRVMRDTVSDPT